MGAQIFFLMGAGPKRVHDKEKKGPHMVKKAPIRRKRHPMEKKGPSYKVKGCVCVWGGGGAPTLAPTHDGQ